MGCGASPCLGPPAGRNVGAGFKRPFGRSPKTLRRPPPRLWRGPAAGRIALPRPFAGTAGGRKWTIFSKFHRRWPGNGPPATLPRAAGRSRAKDNPHYTRICGLTGFSRPPPRRPGGGISKKLSIFPPRAFLARPGAPAGWNVGAGRCPPSARSAKKRGRRGPAVRVGACRPVPRRAHARPRVVPSSTKPQVGVTKNHGETADECARAP